MTDKDFSEAELEGQKEPPAFRCSFEELRDSLPAIEKEFAEGKFISHEQMKRK